MNWKLLKLSVGPSYELGKDTFSSIDFARVTSNDLRLELQLQETYSAGILRASIE